MSSTNEILDALVARAVAAVPELTAGNAERSLRLAKDLNGEEVPHLFVHNPDEAVELLPYLQEQITLSVSLTLVTRDESQTATLAKSELIRAAIRAEPTLGGLVRWAYVSNFSIREHPIERDRAGDIVVVVVTEV